VEPHGALHVGAFRAADGSQVVIGQAKHIELLPSDIKLLPW
jgi:hypothetical protein